MAARGMIIKSMVHELLDTYQPNDAHAKFKTAMSDISKQLEAVGLELVPEDTEKIHEKLNRVAIAHRSVMSSNHRGLHSVDQCMTQSAPVMRMARAEFITRAFLSLQQKKRPFIASKVGGDVVLLDESVTNHIMAGLASHMVGVPNDWHVSGLACPEVGEPQV